MQERVRGGRMVTISLCMIVRDEEKTLGRCLSSVKDAADEIIIVDTGSVDETKRIASQFTDRIYDFPWIDDFSAARNFSFSKATMDYIMWLDADDVIIPEDLSKLVELKSALDPRTDVVMLKYNVGFDRDGNVTLSYYRSRILKRSRGFTWLEPVHEYIQPSGQILTSDISVTHKKERRSEPGRNVRVFEKVLAEGKKLSPRSLYYYARELRDTGKNAEAAARFSEYLDLDEGWVEDKIAACHDLSLCYASLGDKVRRLRTLLRSFEYDTPRAEICCQLGNYYFEAGQYAKAIVWYKIAAGLPKPSSTWGFLLHDCWGFLPNIQLCVCHDKIGEREQAERYNEKAAEYKPNAPSVIHNREYFRKVRGQPR